MRLMVEKGEFMYQTPEINQVGSASELIKAYAGPRYDGGAYLNSQGFVCSPLEEE